MALLADVPGYVVTQYSGDSVRFDADSNVLALRGSPQVAREGYRLVADTSIIYDRLRAEACGYGDPVLSAAEMSHPLASDTVCFDVERKTAFARGAQTTVDEGASWIVRGDVYYAAGAAYSHRAMFTDCDEEEPHYHFGARVLKVVRGNVMVARDVTLNFGDVPVFWLPFMVQSLSRGRRSGILMPRFGINDIARNSARHNRRIEDVGVYWAINDYMGAEVAMDWFSDNWTALRGSLDYNWTRRFLRGGITWRQFWKDEGGREFTVASRNQWQPDERTHINATANYSTSSSFVQSRSFDPRELNRSIDSYASVRRRFDWGSTSLGISRKQFLSDNTVNWQLPSLNVNFSPVTLFEALPGEDRWYSNASWQGGADLKVDRTDVGAESMNLRAQSRRRVTSGLRSTFSMGPVSWSQNANFDEETRSERVLPGDSLAPLPAFSEQRGRWNTSVNFQQRLVGTSTFTPGVALGSEFIRNETTANSTVSAPLRLDFNATLRTDLFGFWGGIGPVERMRHRISPTIRYNYSPEARADSVQRVAFTRVGVAEQNRLSIGLSQTFEARYRTVASDTAGAGEPGDTTRAGTGGGQAQEPRRRQQTPTVKLLSISTNAVVYDFVRAREQGDGVVTTQLRNSVQSDLLRGLQLSFTHDLFETTAAADAGDTSRRFAPHLSRLNASFSLNGNSWLFRILRLGSSDSMPSGEGSPPIQSEDVTDGGPAVDRTESEYGLIGTSRRTAPGAPRGAAGAWNASFNYTLSRPRPGVSSTGNQMVTGNVSFQPTQNWTLRWNTGYSFSNSQFTDHILTLTRSLHDWDANFDFVKAQNGNFSFQFRVHLRANPDIKLDYSQNDVRGGGRVPPPR